VWSSRGDPFELRSGTIASSARNTNFQALSASVSADSISAVLTAIAAKPAHRRLRPRFTAMSTGSQAARLRSIIAFAFDMLDARNF
jgi:hypothetical protein